MHIYIYRRIYISSTLGHSEARARLSRIQVPGSGEQGVQRVLRGAPQGRHISTCGADDGGAVRYPQGDLRKRLSPCLNKRIEMRVYIDGVREWTVAGLPTLDVRVWKIRFRVGGL